MKRFLFPLLLSTAALAPLALRANELTPELAARYETILLQSPGHGAAFDQVIEWYSTKGGGLEALQKKWETAVAEKPEQRQAYQIASGMLAQRLHQPQKARQWYRDVLAQSGGDPSRPARLLAELETTEGNLDEAAKAYETALKAGKLPPVERLELIRSLALLHARNFEEEKALALWREAMREFADDPHVLQEAGEAFLAARQYDEARKTFEALRKASERDPFRRVAASIALAQTADQEGKTEEAAAIYLATLEETSEGSWMSRDVRSRIEELYRRKDDLPGLRAFYEKALATRPQDHRMLQALSRVQSHLNHADEALATLRRATELAPGDEPLRLEFIRSIAAQGKQAEALKEAETLARSGEASAAVLLLLGDLQWRAWLADGEKTPALKEAAYATWRRLVPPGSRDMNQLGLLADLLERHDGEKEAITLWQTALEQEPGAVDIRQRLATLHLKQKDEAAARKVLEEAVASGDASTATYLAVIRAQAAMEWKDAAAATLKAALAKHPKEYEILNYAWRAALEREAVEEVTQLFPRIWAGAPNLFFAEEVVKQYVAAMSTAGKERPWESDGTAWPAPLPTLVKLAFAIQNREEEPARQALTALEQAPGAGAEEKIRLARARSMVADAFGDVDEQLAALKAMGETDARYATESLRKSAAILASAHREKEALALLDELISRAPGDASLYTEYAGIALAMHDPEMASRRLRVALRHVENGTPIRLQLVSIAEKQGDYAEAVRRLFSRDLYPTERFPGRPRRVGPLPRAEPG